MKTLNLIVLLSLTLFARASFSQSVKYRVCSPQLNTFEVFDIDLSTQKVKNHSRFYTSDGNVHEQDYNFQIYKSQSVYDRVLLDDLAHKAGIQQYQRAMQYFLTENKPNGAVKIVLQIFFGVNETAFFIMTPFGAGPLGRSDQCRQ